MEENLGKDYLDYIDPVLETGYIKNVRFSFKQYLTGIRPIKYSQTIVKKKDILFHEVDGKELKLDIFHPKKEGSYPIIILIHGGGFVIGSKDSPKNERLCYLLANLGYTVLNIDYRLVSLKYLTSKKINLKNKLIFCEMIADIRAAISYAQTHAQEIYGNPMEIFLFGRSAGGHLALLSAISCFGRFYDVNELDGDILEHKILGVIAFYPLTDFAAFFDYYGKQNLSRFLLERGVGGTTEDIKYFYQVFSPTTYVTEKNKHAIPPIFLATGGKDRMVTPDQSRRLFRRLKSLEIPSVLLDLPWANHSFDNIVNGPGGQLVLKYLSQFLAWVITKNKLDLIEELAEKSNMKDMITREKHAVIQKLIDYEIANENDIKQFLEEINIQYVSTK
jgi:acetyl esterase/lipase